MGCLLVLVVLFSFCHSGFAASNYTQYSDYACSHLDDHCLDTGVCNKYSTSSKVWSGQVSECSALCAANAECFGFQVIGHGRQGEQCSLFSADLCEDDLIVNTDSSLTYGQFVTAWQPQGNDLTCDSSVISPLYACTDDTGACLPADISFGCSFAGDIGQNCVGFELDDEVLTYRYHFDECDDTVPPADNLQFYIVSNITSNFTRPNTTIIGFCDDAGSKGTMGQYMCGCKSQEGGGTWDGIPCGLFQDLLGCIDQIRTYFLVYSYNKIIFSIANAFGWPENGSKIATVIVVLLVLAKMMYFLISGRLTSGSCIAFIDLLGQLIGNAASLSLASPPLYSASTGCIPFSTTSPFTEAVTFDSQFVNYPLLSLELENEIPDAYTDFIAHFEDFVAYHKSAELAVERMYGAREGGDMDAYWDRRSEAQAFCEDFLELADASQAHLEVIVQQIIALQDTNVSLPLDMSVFRDDLRDFILDVQLNGYPKLDQTILNRFESDDEPIQLITDIELFEFFWDEIGYGESISMREIFMHFHEIFVDRDGQGFRRLCDECQWDSGCHFEQTLCVDDGVSIKLKCACDLGEIDIPFETFPPGTEGFDCSCNPVDAAVLLFITSTSDDGNKLLLLDDILLQAGITKGGDLSKKPVTGNDVVGEEAQSTIAELIQILFEVTGVSEERLRVISSQQLSDDVLTNVAVMPRAEGSGDPDQMYIIEAIESEMDKGVASAYPLLAVDSQMICIHNCPDDDGDSEDDESSSGESEDSDGESEDSGGEGEDNCCTGDEASCKNIIGEQTCIARACTWTCESTSCCQGVARCSQSRGSGRYAKEACERSGECSWVCD